MATDTLYEDDFVIRTERQAEALRSASRQVSNLPVDWENLAEEIESVGRSERAEIRSLIGQIVSHLLKLVHSPAVQTRAGWESEVSYARERLPEGSTTRRAFGRSCPSSSQRRSRAPSGGRAGASGATTRSWRPKQRSPVL